MNFKNYFNIRAFLLFYLIYLAGVVTLSVIDLVWILPNKIDKFSGTRTTSDWLMVAAGIALLIMVGYLFAKQCKEHYWSNLIILTLSAPLLNYLRSSLLPWAIETIANVAKRQDEYSGFYPVIGPNATWFGKDNLIILGYMLIGAGVFFGLSHLKNKT